MTEADTNDDLGLLERLLRSRRQAAAGRVYEDSSYDEAVKGAKRAVGRPKRVAPISFDPRLFAGLAGTADDPDDIDVTADIDEIRMAVSRVQQSIGLLGQQLALIGSKLDSNEELLKAQADAVLQLARAVLNRNS